MQAGFECETDEHRGRQQTVDEGDAAPRSAAQYCPKARPTRIFPAASPNMTCGCDRRPGDAEWTVVRVVAGNQHCGLHTDIDGRRDERGGDQPERASLTLLPRTGQLPQHDGGSGDLHEAVETEPRERN